jgi:hypothetical protein
MMAADERRTDRLSYSCARPHSVQRRAARSAVGAGGVVLLSQQGVQAHGTIDHKVATYNEGARLRPPRTTPRIIGQRWDPRSGKLLFLQRDKDDYLTTISACYRFAQVPSRARTNPVTNAGDFHVRTARRRGHICGNSYTWAEMVRMDRRLHHRPRHPPAKTLPRPEVLPGTN